MFSSLNLLFGDVLVVLAVVVCLSSLVTREASRYLTRSLYIFVSFTACSIQCYQCVPKATPSCSASQTPDQCDAHQTRATCPEGLDSCVRSRFTNASIVIEKRSCANKKTCGSVEVSCEQLKKEYEYVTCHWSCCQEDLCNASVYPIAQCIMMVMIACVLIAFF